MELPKAPTEKGQQRYQAIVDSALELFIQHGYAKTTLSMIIDKAGGSRRNISERFGGKKGLFHAVLKNCQAKLVKKFKETDYQNRRIEETLHTFGMQFMTGYLTPISIGLYRILVGEVSQFPELSMNFLNSAPFKTYGAIAKCLIYFEQKGEIKLTNADIQASQFLESIKGPLLIRALFDDDFKPTQKLIKQHVDTAVKTFLQGVRV